MVKSLATYHHHHHQQQQQLPPPFVISPPYRGGSRCFFVSLYLSPCVASMCRARLVSRRRIHLFVSSRHVRPAQITTHALFLSPLSLHPLVAALPSVCVFLPCDPSARIEIFPRSFVQEISILLLSSHPPQKICHMPTSLPACLASLAPSPKGIKRSGALKPNPIKTTNQKKKNNNDNKITRVITTAPLPTRAHPPCPPITNQLPKSHHPRTYRPLGW